MAKLSGYILLLLVLLIIMISGCIGESPSTSTGVTGNSSTSSTPTTTPASELIFPEKVSFIAVLTVAKNGTTIANYSYTATIDYIRGNANVTRRSVYHPGDPRLTGNWHVEKILIENRTSVRFYVVPPATWIPVPENQTADIIASVFDGNPYSILFSLLENTSNCRTCAFHVRLTPEEVSKLLEPLVGKENPPDIPLEGTAFVKDGFLIKVHLHGDNYQTYEFILEVKEK